MGRHEGIRAQGAKGKSSPLERSTDALATLADGQELDLKDLAKSHAEEAFGVHLEVMREADTPPVTRLSAARAIIEYGHGKSATQEKETPQSLGMTVNILQFGGPDGLAAIGAKEALEILSSGTPDAATPVEAQWSRPVEGDNPPQDWTGPASFEVESVPAEDDDPPDTL